MSELDNLKRRRYELTEEKKRLKARIAKIDAESQKNIRAVVNPRLISELDREYAAINEEVEKHRRELDNIRMSDSAAVRIELQEEVKVIYLERMRLEQFQIAQQQELNAVKDEYDALMAEEGPEACAARAKKLEKYREKLDKYKVANDGIAQKIRTIRANRAFDNDEGRKKISKRAEELRQEIESAQSEADEILAETEALTRKHRQEMRALRTGTTSPQRGHKI